jgi:hypothetical protein
MQVTMVHFWTIYNLLQVPKKFINFFQIDMVVTFLNVIIVIFD